MKNNTKNKKNSLFSVSNIIYACIILLALAAAIVLAVIGGEKPLEIADENGEENYSLAVLTENEICEEEPKFSCKVFGVGIDENAQNINDSDKVTAEAKAAFSGVAVLQKTECEAETVTFTVNCVRAKGNLRVVLLGENMHVLHDFTVGESSSFTLEGAKGKSFELRLAGESAEFTVTVERTFG